MRSPFMSERRPSATAGAAKLRGVYLGVVTNNAEGDGNPGYRVKVTFPWLPGARDESAWARIAVPMAGGGRGTYLLPELEDQVLCVFEHGDIRRPIVIGAVWSDAQPPPEANRDGKNHLRVIKSKSGHRLIFDDTNGAERVILVDSSGTNKIVLDAASDSVTLESGSGDIEICAPSGVVRVHGKSLTMTSSGKVTARAGVKLQVATRGALNCKAAGDLILRAPMTQLNPDGFGGGGGGGRGGGGDGGSGAAVTPRDQVQERQSDVASAPGSSIGGAPAQREAAALREAGDEAAVAAELTTAASLVSDLVLAPGQPVALTALAVNTAEVIFEVIDAETGAIIAALPGQVQDGRARATWDGKVAEGAARVLVRSRAGASVSESAPLSIAGRDELGPSPAQATDGRELAAAADLHAGAAGDVGGALGGRAGAGAAGDVGGALGGRAGAGAAGDVGGALGGRAGAGAAGDVGGALGSRAGAGATGDVSGALGGRAGAGATGDVSGALGGRAGAGAAGDVSGAAGGDVSGALGGDVSGAAAGDVGGALGARSDAVSGGAGSSAGDGAELPREATSGEPRGVNEPEKVLAQRSKGPSQNFNASEHGVAESEPATQDPMQDVEPRRALEDVDSQVAIAEPDAADARHRKHVEGDAGRLERDARAAGDVQGQVEGHSASITRDAAAGPRSAGDVGTPSGVEDARGELRAAEHDARRLEHAPAREADAAQRRHDPGAMAAPAELDRGGAEVPGVDHRDAAIDPQGDVDAASEVARDPETAARREGGSKLDSRDAALDPQGDVGAASDVARDPETAARREGGSKLDSRDAALDPQSDVDAASEVARDPDTAAKRSGRNKLDE